MSENNTQIRMYTLTFNLTEEEGKNNFPDLTGAIDCTVTLPTAQPTKEGYVFAGWENETGVVFFPGRTYTFIYEDDTLTPIWEEVYFTITYEPGGGSDTVTQQAYPGQTITLYEPSRFGFTFYHWEDSAGNCYDSGDTYTVGFANETFTAKWQSTITFNLDGGDGDYPDITREEMTRIWLPEAPTKVGYHFVKWINENQREMLPGEPYFFMGDDTLTAVWEIAWHTLTYNLNGADTPDAITSQEGQATTNIILSDTVPTKEGYTFIRWENSEGEVFQPGEPYFFDYHDDTLTAVWGYTVTLDLADGRVETVKGAVGETLEYIPISENVAFYSWINNNYQEFLPGEYTFIYGDDYLTAMWGYAASYDTKGGTGDFPTQTTLFGGIISIPNAAPVKEGYDFNGWISSEGDMFYPGGTYDKNESTILTAVWTCNLYFDTNGGNEDSYLISALSEGEVFGLPVPTRSNYTFSHWVNDDGIEFYPEDEYKLIYGHDNLTAIWEGTVTFDTNGGENVIESITAFNGETITLPIPNREGYDFVCWRNGMETDYNDTFHMLYGNDTLIAIWELKTYNISYNVEGYENQTKEYFTSVTLHTSVPTREGYTFLNWEGNDGSYYDAGEEYIKNESLSLTAVWVADGDIVITYDLNGSTGNFPKQTKGVDESITLHADQPVAEGMGFYRWIDQNGNTYERGDTYSGSESLKLKADMKKAYTYTYLKDDGSVFATQTKLEGVPLTVPSEKPNNVTTIDGYYRFWYWEIQENGNITLPERTLETNTDITLVAIMRRIYYIVYEGGDHYDDYLEIAEKPHDGHIVIKAPEETEIEAEKDGHTFMCWQWKNKNEYYFPGDVFKNNEAGKLNAVWRRNQNIKIIFDIGDANGEYAPIEVFPGTEVTIPNNVPTKEGYIFDAWGCTELGESVEAASYNIARTGSMETEINKYFASQKYRFYLACKLFPIWKRTYTVSYDTNGANESFPIQTKEKDVPLTIYSTIPTKAHCTFAGWKGKNTSVCIDAGGVYELNQSETLVAQWEGQSLLREIEVIPSHKTIGLDEGCFYADVKFYPEDASDKTIYWSSSNSSIASVDRETGKITPKKAGKVTITAYTNGRQQSDDFELIVDNREKVIVEKDSEYINGNYFNIIFPDGLIWKSIGCDISANQSDNKLSETVILDYHLLLPHEKRYVDNRTNFYSEEEMALIYFMDPLGAEYYLKNIDMDFFDENNDKGWKEEMISMLIYKDNVYKAIFGDPPLGRFKFKVDEETGNISYQEFSGESRYNYLTNAEILFGHHVILKPDDFWLNVVKAVIKDIFNHVCKIGDAVEVCQTLFHAGAFVGVNENTLNWFYDEYIKKATESNFSNLTGIIPSNPFKWVINLFKVLIDSALSSFVIPNVCDIQIYNNIQNNNTYRVIYKNGMAEFFMDEIIEKCE